MFFYDYYVTIFVNGSWKHIIKDGGNAGFLDATSGSSVIDTTNRIFTTLISDDINTSFSVQCSGLYLQSNATWAPDEHIFTNVGTVDHIEGEGDPILYGISGQHTNEGIYFIKSNNWYYTGPFPPTNATGNFNTAVCFLEGTNITTDQGPVAIEQLTQNNTIFGSKVNNITESNNFFGHLIHFKPNALANNLPSTDTFLTPTHAIFCPKDKCMKMAKDFCDGENVVEDFTKDKTCKIYNVVCEDDNGDITAHSMYVNNMLCECLHPHAYPLVKNQLKW